MIKLRIRFLPAALLLVFAASALALTVQSVGHSALRGAEKAQNAVVHGARAVASGVAHGAHVAGHAVSRGARKIGLPTAPASAAKR
ncbi:MAG: hypothetical protein KGM91_16820 [Burkholderiales bacterium]|nr:hypothetical protein [Burkholderiales bacterium]